ncbi:hypothetical protein [Bartonella florencae]|uniref:hypothetical protein n=1 Tax=Bartonella florencae TaxID=928210 RepID=UPI0002E28E16|nr:hypothetical protein [Bartonella florencae]
MGGLREFRNIKKSNFGDFLKHEGIFNHEGGYWGKYHISGRCFIENERIFIDSIFFHDVFVSTKSCVYEGRQTYSILSFFSIIPVYSSAQVYDSRETCIRLYVCNRVKIYCNFKLPSNLYIDSLICVYAKICEKAKLYCHTEDYDYKDFRNEKGVFIESSIPHATRNLDKNDTEEISVEQSASLALFENICVLVFCVNKYAVNSWYERKDLGSFWLFLVGFCVF